MEKSRSERAGERALRYWSSQSDEEDFNYTRGNQGSKRMVNQEVCRRRGGSAPSGASSGKVLVVVLERRRGAGKKFAAKNRFVGYAGGQSGGRKLT
jgi:hypothetical protein